MWNSRNRETLESEEVNDRFKLIQGGRRDVRNLFAWERTVKRDANLWRKSCCDVTGRGSRRKRMSVTFPYFRAKSKECENKRNGLFCNQAECNFLDRKRDRRNVSFVCTKVVLWRIDTFFFFTGKLDRLRMRIRKDCVIWLYEKNY